MARRDVVRESATILDVARISGVSRSTVSRALGGNGAVSPDARARVLAAAEQLGYHANGVARSMITGRTYTLGAIVADIENVYFARAVRGFTDGARAEGFDVIITNTDENLSAERAALDVMLEKRVDGLLVAPASMTDVAHLRRAHSGDLPLVLLDRRVSGLSVDTVMVDNVAAAREAVDRLIAFGHERIGLVTGGLPDRRPQSAPNLVSTGADRVDGYRQALRDAGIAVREDYLRCGDFHREAACAEALELLSMPDRPTAVFATDSIISLGVLEAVQRLDLVAPRDVSLVGMDDADWMTVVRPRLSVVAQPVYDLGAAAARRLISRVRREVVRAKVITLPTEWIERESIGRPPAHAHRDSAGAVAPVQRAPGYAKP